MRKHLKNNLIILMAIFLIASLTCTTILTASAENSVLVNQYDSLDAPIFDGCPFHLMSDYINVKAGDELYFGPCVPSQGFQIGEYNNKSATLGTPYDASSFTVVSTFDNGEVIYKLTIPSGVSCVRAVNNAANNDVYLITKNQAFDSTSFMEYWSGNGIDALYYVSGSKTATNNIENLFNNENPINGYYDANGKLVAGEYYTSGFIVVNEGDTVYYGPASAMSIMLIAGYDSAKGKVTGLLSTKGSAIVDIMDSPNAIFSYKVPAGVSYVAITVASGMQTTELVTINQPFDSVIYTEYFKKLTTDVVVKTDSVLYGKTALFCGDSICAAAYHDKTLISKTGWSGRIALYYGMTTTNNGLDGASVSTRRVGNRILDQITSVSKNKYDYVILHGGVNDAMDSVAIGTMTESFELKDFNIATFAGGLDELFYYAKKDFGDTTLIGYIINFQTPKSDWGGKTRDMSAYFDIAKQICDKWKIPYLDLYNDADFNNNKMKVTTKENLIDYLHPNTAGYDVIYKDIATWMETLGQDIGDDSSATVTSNVTESEANSNNDIVKDNNTLPYIIGGIFVLVIVGAVIAFFNTKKKK